jgi:hypothetical protein
MNPDHPKYNAEIEEAKALVIRDIATQHFAEKERQKLIDTTIADQNRAWGQPDPIPNDSEAPPYEILWNEIAEWSNRVFGDEQQRGPWGPLNHLRREVDEAQNALSRLAEAYDEESVPTTLDLEFETELADCLILIFDVARRARMTAMSLVGTALEKMEVNRGRVMGEPDEEGVIEHLRE